MVNEEKIASYVESLLYYVARPRIAEAVAASFNIESLSKADTGAQLLIQGALLATGRFNEFSLLLQKLDFSDNTPDERSHLAQYIYTAFSETLLDNYSLASQHATALMQLLLAISSDAILAHKLPYKAYTPAPLIELNYSPTVTASVSGVVFFREFMFGKGTRKHEFGYRIQSALASQGWDVSLLPLQEVSQYVSPGRADFALIDILLFAATTTIDQICTILTHLKQHFRKIIIIEPDPWTGLYDERLLAISEHVDYVWGFTADWSVTKDPRYIGRSILFPNVGGFDHLEHLKQADLDGDTCTFNFTGSVQGYNLNRIYWILESISRNLPVEIKVTQPELDDGLDRESSLALYANALASTHASLNMTTRKDGSRIITGRATEIISLNRLLIQESCPAFQQYYVEGEHFLEFSDIEGLCTIIEFLRSHPRVAQKICSQGYQFYQERYSCRKLVEHIQTLF